VTQAYVGPLSIALLIGLGTQTGTARLARTTHPQSEKHLELTLTEVKLAMDANNGELRRAVLRVPRMRGQLRLDVRCKSPVPVAWQMSIALYSTRLDRRVDCIDWEGRFGDVNGQICSGFHRHVWDPQAMSCDLPKLSLPEFNPATIADFITMGFAMMRIAPRKEEILNRIQMAKLTLRVILVLFSIGFLAFIVAMFVLPSDAWAKTILGGVDTLLGVRMAQIGKHLYPSREPQA
jgi:hypothetical protein